MATYERAGSAQRGTLAFMQSWHTATEGKGGGKFGSTPAATSQWRWGQAMGICIPLKWLPIWLLAGLSNGSQPFELLASLLNTHQLIFLQHVGNASFCMLLYYNICMYNAVKCHAYLLPLNSPVSFGHSDWGSFLFQDREVLLGYWRISYAKGKIEVQLGMTTDVQIPGKKPVCTVMWCEITTRYWYDADRVDS